jgi:hypothetical protein
MLVIANIMEYFFVGFHLLFPFFFFNKIVEKENININTNISFVCALRSTKNLKGKRKEKYNSILHAKRNCDALLLSHCTRRFWFWHHVQLMRRLEHDLSYK